VCAVSSSVTALAKSILTAASSTSTAGSTLSSKPWFLTFDLEDKNVFIWKNNCRLQGNENEGCGCVAKEVVVDESEGVLFCMLYLFLCLNTI